MGPRFRGDDAPRAGSAADAFDFGAAMAELVLEALKTAVEVVDAVDHGFAAGREAGDDQRDRGAQISRHHLRALEGGNTGDGGGLAFDADVGAEAGELGDMHEAVLEDGLADVRDAASHRPSAP